MYFDYPPLDALYDDIRNLPQSAKKALITLARAQCPCPSSTSSVLLSKLRPFYNAAARGKWSDLSYSLVKELGAQPHTSGLLISLCLSAPISASEARAVRVESVIKEFMACNGNRYPSQFNWHVLFDPVLSKNEPLSKTTPARPQLNGLICNVFHGFKRRLEGRRILPHFTTKGVSKSTQEDAQRVGVEPLTNGSFITNEDIVRHYIREGVMTGGKVGMKQKHYPTGLAPRTYFSTGGEALYHSMYLREIFNELCDVFDPTNRYLRVCQSRLQCPENGFFLIYDLTSFSSNFSEQVYFLDALSSFLEDTYVRVIGPNLYATSISVGGMIRDYLHFCNDFPEFYNEVPLLHESFDSHLRFTHSVAGFLGVYGNLASCTLPHGLALVQHARNMENTSCAGDDAAIGLHDDDHLYATLSTIESLGILQREKVYESREEAVYLKRPFLQVGENGLIGDMVIWPLLTLVGNVVSDPRFPDIASLTFNERRNMVASALFSFRRHFASNTLGGLTETEREVTYSYCRKIHGVMRLPLEGYLPQCEVESTSKLATAVFPLTDSGDLDDNDPIYDLIDRCYTGYVSVPHLGSTKFVPTGDLIEGFSFQSTPSRHLRFLEKMGYVYHEQEHIYFVGEEGKDVLRKLFTSKLSKEYTYRVLESLDEAQLVSIGMMQAKMMEEEVLDFSFGKKRYHDWDRPEMPDWKRLRYDPDDSDSDEDDDTEVHRTDRDNLPRARILRHFEDLTR